MKEYVCAKFTRKLSCNSATVTVDGRGAGTRRDAGGWGGFFVSFATDEVDLY